MKTISKDQHIPTDNGCGIPNKHRLAAVVNTRPDIRFIITDYYNGTVNDVLYMVIRNALQVMVSIVSVDGCILESGQANNNNSVWSYRAQTSNPDFPGMKVLILATDSKGNQSNLAIPLF